MFKRKKEMQSLINSSRKTLADAEDRISQRNKLIKNLYDKNKKLKVKIVDLENNIEFLVNNLSPQKRAKIGLDTKKELADQPNQTSSK